MSEYDAWQKGVEACNDWWEELLGPRLLSNMMTNQDAPWPTMAPNPYEESK